MNCHSNVKKIYFDLIEDSNLSPIKALQYVNIILQTAKILSFRLDAKLLLCHVLQISQESLLTKKTLLTPKERKSLTELTMRRLKNEPMAYIIGRKEFFSLDFIVNKNVLIPRPDSETLVNSVLNNVNNTNVLQILELGIGSGCIIITLLKYLTHAFGYGVDICKKAIQVAKANAIFHKVEHILRLTRSNWYEKVTGKFDIIVSNPPYIDHSYTLPKELMFEPKFALYAEQKGLAHYHSIAKHSSYFLKPNGSIYLEIGYQMEKEIIDIFKDHNFFVINTYKDLSQITRCLQFNHNRKNNVENINFIH